MYWIQPLWIKAWDCSGDRMGKPSILWGFNGICMHIKMAQIDLIRLD
jgi:hypothetical protein